MSAARSFPNWVMLERFIFRVDDDKNFPDDDEALIRASGLTSLENPFHVAFRLSNPPGISRIYVQLPGFPNSNKFLPFAVVATHRHLVLFSLTFTVDEPPCQIDVQDLIIYNASATDEASSSQPQLKALPPCTELYNDGPRIHRAPPPAPSGEKENLINRRMVMVRSTGLLCRGKEEFAVVELNLYRSSPRVVEAQLCLLRSHISTGPMGTGSGWCTIRLPIHVHGDPDDMRQLYAWKTDAVIPFDKQLCWIDYLRGILFYDVFNPDSASAVSFLPFPVDETPRNKGCFWMYRGVSVLDASHVLKFIDVARDDGLGFESLKRGAGFTVTCYNLVLGEQKKHQRHRAMEWRKDYKITCNELWSINSPECLPRTLLMFPQVNIDRPHIVHFLVPELRYVIKKMWVVAIDMNTQDRGVIFSVYQWEGGP